MVEDTQTELSEAPRKRRDRSMEWSIRSMEEKLLAEEGTDSVAYRTWQHIKRGTGVCKERRLEWLHKFKNQKSFRFVEGFQWVTREHSDEINQQQGYLTEAMILKEECHNTKSTENIIEAAKAKGWDEGRQEFLCWYEGVVMQEYRNVERHGNTTQQATGQIALQVRPQGSLQNREHVPLEDASNEQIQGEHSWTDWQSWNTRDWSSWNQSTTHAGHWEQDRGADNAARGGNVTPRAELPDEHAQQEHVAPGRSGAQDGSPRRRPGEEDAASLADTVTGSDSQPLLKRARVGPARKPPTLADYDVVVPRAWDTMVGLDCDPQWPLLQPFADSLTEALKELESSRTEENLLIMDREMNLLCSVSAAVWNWKELDDPWTSARTLADVE